MKNPPVGIILAAGRGQRLAGQLKPLLPIGKKTFLEKIVKDFIRLRLKKIIVVLGYQAEVIKDYLRLKGFARQIEIIVNRKFWQEQIESLRLAIKKCPKNFSGIIFTPVDYPLIKSATYRQLLWAWDKDRQKICLPSYNFRKGHPAIFPRWAAELLMRKKLSGGAREIFQEYPQKIKYVGVNDPGILQDIDTIADWKKYISSL